MAMKITHKTTLNARCPHGARDVYEVTIELDRLVTVEEIQEKINAVNNTPLYQEELTQLIADEVGATVTTRGHHGAFETTVTCYEGQGE